MKARLIVLFAAVSILAVGSPVWAQNWAGTNSANWNDTGNWGGTFPTGDANVYTNSPNIATITANSLFTPNDIVIGGGAQINHIAGSLSTGGGWSSIGTYGNTGIYNLAGTGGTGGTFTGYGLGSGSLTLGGLLDLGGVNQGFGSTSGNGTFNMNTTGVLTIQGGGGYPGTSLAVGNHGATGVFNLDNGTITATSADIWIGNGIESGVPGTGTLNMSGGLVNAPSMYVGQGGGLGVVNLVGGTVTLTGNAVFGSGGTGATATSSGTLSMSGGVLNVAGNLAFGQVSYYSGAYSNPTLGSQTGGTGVMNLTGGTVNANYVAFGYNLDFDYDRSSGTGTIGTGAVLNSKTWVDVGEAGSGVAGLLTINGTLNVNTANAGGGLSVARGETVQGTVTINPGAMVRIENNGQIVFARGQLYSGETGVINQNGGSVVFYSDAGTTVGGTGFLNMMGNQNYGGNYTYNLSGGTLQVPQIGCTPNNGYSNATFNFNGGVLKATGNQSAFFNFASVGNSFIQVQSGGAIIDDSGFSIGIGQNLNGSPGDGGLTVLGGGMLTLIGNNSYTGGTTVNGGTLNVNSDAALGTAPGSPTPSVTFTHNGTLQFGANNVSLNANRTIVLNGNTVALDTAGNAQAAIAGSIVDGSGPGSIVLANNGVMTLSGSSNYTGTTTVNIGTLNLASGTLGATAVSIGPLGTLTASGTSSIAGNVTTTGAGAAVNLQNGTIDTLSLGGALSLHAGSVMGFDLGPVAGSSDTIAVAGAVSLGGTNTVNFSAAGALNAGEYTLLTSASGGIAAADFTVGTHPFLRGSFNLATNTTANALVLTVVANPTPAVAYWTGSGSRAASDAANNWAAGPGNTTNWATDATGGTDAGQVPGSITSVYFTAANATPGAGGVLTTQLDANYAIQGLTVAVPATATQITSTVVNPNGHTLTLGSGGLTLAAGSSSSATIGSGSVLLSTTSQSWANNDSSLSLTVSANVAPQSNIGPTSLTFNGTDVGGIGLDGRLSDASFSPLSLVFNQAGVTQLNGSNTFTGGVTISSGTVQIGNSAALNATSPNAVNFGSGSYIAADLQLNGKSVTVSALNANDGTVTATVENGAATPATLTVSNTASSSYNGVLQDGTSSSLTLTKAATGTLYLTGYAANTYTGGTNLNGGVLNFFSGTLPVSGIGFHGGTLQWASGNADDVSAGISPIAAGQAAILDTHGNYVSFASSLSGSGGLTKTGGGALTLLNSNSYSGATTVNGGTLQIDNGGSVATTGSGNIVIGGGGIMALDRSDSYVLNNSFSGAGTLYQIGSGTVSLVGTNTGVGITVESGAVALAGNNNTALGHITVTGAGALNVVGGASTTQSLDIATQNGDSAVVNMLPGSSFSGAFIGAGEASGGTGTINMTGGTVNTNGNELHVGTTTGALGMVNMSGGVLNLSSTGAGNAPFLDIAVIYPGGNVSGVFNMSGGSIHVAGAVSIGTFTDNQGTLSVSGGTIQADHINVGSDGTGTMTLTGGVVMGSRVTMGEYGTGNGTLNLQGGLVQTGEVSAYTGSGVFNFSGGTLENSPAGYLHVYAPVNLSGPGTVVLQPSTTGEFYSAAPISGGGSLYLTGGGTLTLGGSNTYTGGTNVFAGELIVTSPQGIQDGSNLFVGSAGSFFAPPVPSFAGGTGAGSAAPAVASVPEPGTLALLTAVAAATLAAQRRRKRRDLHRNNN